MAQLRNTMQALMAKCADQTKCALAHRVYEDLKEDKRVTNLESYFDMDLNLLYLRGDRAGASVIFVPILSSQDLNLIQMQKIQTKLAANNALTITLAICDTSSTVLYYKMTSGIEDK